LQGPLENDKGIRAGTIEARIIPYTVINKNVFVPLEVERPQVSRVGRRKAIEELSDHGLKISQRGCAFMESEKTGWQKSTWSVGAGNRARDDAGGVERAN
jgi:hypothetical protein